MTNIVWDSSTLLALLLREPPAHLDQLLEFVVMSSVSLAEVRTKLIDLNRLDLMALEEDLRLAIRIVDFTTEHAVVAGDMRAATRQYGLSLGDRACLALALSLGANVYTADAAWTKVELACKVHLIR